MQNPTAPPRDHLTQAQIDALLTAPSLEVDFGAEVLDLNLVYQQDISADVEGGRVARNMNNRIHGTCEIRLSRTLDWGVDLVRPWMSLTDGTVEARWDVGTYMLTTPERRIGDDPELYVAQGYDRLILLDRPVGEDYAETAGTTYRQALLDAFTAAGLTGVVIDGSAADATLPADKSWPLVADDQADPDQTDSVVTWLRVVNDLLRAINFRSVWCDESGMFRCQAWQDPASRAIEFVFDADDEYLTIVGDERALSEDVWGMPNRWVFRQSNRASGAPSPTEGDGIYTVDLEDSHPMSATNRGLTWPVVIDYEAASQTVLEELGDRRVAQDKAITSQVAISTGPVPGAGHADVVEYRDAAIGSHKMQVVEWSMPLDGGDMQWTMETVA